MIVAGGTLCRAWSLGKRSREKFRLKIRVCVIVLLLVAPSAVLPQNGGESLAKPRMDSLGKKNYFLPLAEGAAANGMVWAFDRWALNADYADISVHTMKQNLQTGFVWDNDNISTNMFFVIGNFTILWCSYFMYITICFISFRVFLSDFTDKNSKVVLIFPYIF